jgi:hypothetical protein
LNNIQIYIGWEIETTHLKTGRNVKTKVILEVLLTKVHKYRAQRPSKDVFDNRVVERVVKTKINKQSNI